MNITNSIFTGFQNCIDIDDAATFTAAGTPPNMLSGTLTIQNSILDCQNNFVEEAGDPWTVEQWFNAQDGNEEMAVNLEGVFPPADATYLRGYDLDYDIHDVFFWNYEHVGAFANKEAAWTQGWTLQELDFYP